METENANKYLEGSLVFLRPYESEADTQALYRSSFDPEVNRYTGNTIPFTHRQVSSYIDKVTAGDDSRVDFVIARRSDGSPVGEIVLNDISNRNANMRLCIFSSVDFGKGYGTEAIRLILDYGFGMRNLHRISLSVYDHNARGIHVYEKLGFKREGILRETLFLDHAYRNEIVMSILEDEYRAMHMG